MGCCYSKANRKIDATDSETEGMVDKARIFFKFFSRVMNLFSR